jgi:ComF family protein
MYRGALETAHQCICTTCVSELPWLEKHCQQCALPLATDALCPDCQSNPPAFSRCISAFIYQPPIDNIILRFKKDPYTAEIKQLSALLAERILRSYPPTGSTEPEKQTALPELLIPMPLHWKKMARRGFNQSQVIANHLAKYFLYQHKTSLRVHNDICQRTTNSRAQQTLDKKHRATSVKNAFSIVAQPGLSLKGKTVALLDDVVTTGATANALARIVANAGADRVDIWCLARTGWNNCSH